MLAEPIKRYIPLRRPVRGRLHYVEAAYYGAPPGWIGRVLRVQWDDVFVRLPDPKTGQLLREHVRVNFTRTGWPPPFPSRTT
jgi:hypothetical protein